MDSSFEGQDCELKSAFTWNSRANRKDDSLRYGVFRSIAGLANAEGGRLIIGASDDGGVHGIEDELRNLFEVNHIDQYESLIHEHLRNSLYPHPITSYKIKFESHSGLTTCVIDVKAVAGVTYVVDRTDKSKPKYEVHVRTGNRTIKLIDLERDRFVVKRFGGQWPM